MNAQITVGGITKTEESCRNSRPQRNTENIDTNFVAYILTRSPSFRITSGSLFTGEKWHTQLLTDTQVGKAIPAKDQQWMRKVSKQKHQYAQWNVSSCWPFFISFSFLKILPTSSIIKASPLTHMLSTEVPATAASTTIFRAPVGKEIKTDPQLCGHRWFSLLFHTHFIFIYI